MRDMLPSRSAVFAMGMDSAAAQDARRSPVCLPGTTSAPKDTGILTCKGCVLALLGIKLMWSVQSAIAGCM